MRNKHSECLEFAKTPAVIWRGFEHYWNYNHRVRRMGSFVDFNGDEPKGRDFSTVHTAASGTGKDVLCFKDHYSVLRIPGLFCSYCSYSEILDGKEGKFALIYKRLRMKTPIALKGSNFTVLLNGFDLESLAGPDKLSVLDLSVSATKVGQTELEILLDGKINLDCKTLECALTDDRYNYKLTIHYLVLVGDPGQFNVLFSEKKFENTYSWEKKRNKEIHKEIVGTKNHVLQLPQSLDEFPLTTIGYSAFKIVIRNGRLGKKRDKTVHQLENSYKLADIKQNGNNQIAFSQDIFFKNWKRGMKSYNFFSWFSLRQKGVFGGQSNLVCLQFKEGSIWDDLNNEGKILWRGGNRSQRKDSEVHIPVFSQQDMA